MRDWFAFERFGHMLQAAPWRFAVTMKSNPHHYTLREAWADEEFVEAVLYLREHGYREMYGGRPYIQIDVNEHFYWTMGDRIDRTILINRKPIRREAAYDEIAYRYDFAFRSEEDRAQERAEFERIGPMDDLSVLDVGCGMGLLLQYGAPRRYVGIDPSRGMIRELRHRHPGAAAVCTPLSTFVPPRLPDGSTERYDLVTCLFGTASYLTDDELSRLPTLLAPGGRLVAMFYRAGYEPETYRRCKIPPERRPESRPYAPDLRVAWAERARARVDDRYVTMIYEAPR